MTETALAVDSPLVAPISDSAPAGADISYDPEFERLVAEIEKLTSLAGENPDWRFIRTECEGTLRDKSKDLRVMSWLVAANAHLDGWSGIASGLDVYMAVARTFWPTMFPPLARLRARAGQVEWLWGVLSKKIASLPASSADAASVRALEPRIAEVGAFFAEQLKASDPGMGAVRAALRDKLRTLPELEPPRVTTPSPPPEVAVAPEPSPPKAPKANGAIAAAPMPVLPLAAPVVPVIDASSLAGLEQAQDAARGLRDALMTLAHHARQVAPTAPWSYRLLRTALWLTIDRAPETEDGKTPLRAPKPQDRDLLQNLRAGGKWDGLLETAEDFAGSNVFWLDVHRMTALALENKGPAFRAARDTVVAETVAFVARVSGVAHLLFSNGTPFASPETIEWLAQVSASADAGSAAAAVKDEALDALLADLDERLKTATPADALARALAEAERLPTARGRFCARLAVARQAQTAELVDVALLLYEGLLPEVTPTLEQWEPALAGEVLGNYLKARRVFARNKDVPPAEREASERTEALVLKRLLTVDPHAALRLRAVT